MLMGLIVLLLMLIISIYISLPNICGPVKYCKDNNHTINNCWDAYLNANITDWRNHEQRLQDCEVFLK